MTLTRPPYTAEPCWFLDRALTPGLRADDPGWWRLSWRFHSRQLHRWSLIIRTSIGYRFLIGAEWWRDEHGDACLILGLGWLTIEIEVACWYTHRELRLMTATQLTEQALCRRLHGGPAEDQP